MIASFTRSTTCALAASCMQDGTETKSHHRPSKHRLLISTRSCETDVASLASYTLPFPQTLTATRPPRKVPLAAYGFVDSALTPTYRIFQNILFTFVCRVLRKVRMCENALEQREPRDQRRRTRAYLTFQACKQLRLASLCVWWRRRWSAYLRQDEKHSLWNLSHRASNMASAMRHCSPPQDVRLRSMRTLTQTRGFGVAVSKCKARRAGLSQNSIRG